jgi:uncharacterized protein (TIGR02145 family)
MKDKSSFYFLPLIAMGIILIFTSSCKRDESDNINITIPVVTTSDVTNITQTSAICGGIITDDGGAAITERGICWCTSSDYTFSNNITNDGSGIGSFTCAITGLGSDRYYVKAYAKNSAGIAYGKEICFFTVPPDITFNPALNYGMLTDIDGNEYKTIVIGSQTWMAENLKVTHYRNGDPIPIAISESDLYQTTGYYCNVYLFPSIATIYGKFYNWYAVNDIRNIAPNGWHIPADSEWETLFNFLGGDIIAFPKLKETGNNHWLYINYNNDADNSSGFTAIPAGRYNEMFNYMYRYEGWWWSTTELDTYFAWSRRLVNETSISDSSHYSCKKYYGISVRCVKD